MGWFDSYEIRARVAPAIIMSLPWIVTVCVTLPTFFPKTSVSLATLLGSVVALAVFATLIYAVSLLVRHLGKKAEAGLWEVWDGPPSTRLARWQDMTFGADLKQRIHAEVERVCHVRLLSRVEERGDPEAADAKIGQSFEQVKAVVRHRDSEGLSKKQNAEYGSYRNLFSSRLALALSSALGASICEVLWCSVSRTEAFVFGAVANGALFVLSIAYGWLLHPNLVREAADSYARTTWMSFLTIAGDVAK